MREMLKKLGKLGSFSVSNYEKLVKILENTKKKFKISRKI